MDFSKEIWKDVVGYEGKYMVSNLGRIKSLPRPYVRRESIRVQCDRNIDGVYRRLDLCIKGKRKRFYVHRLVASAFIPNADEKNLWVNRKDGDKDNNALSNLEWVTPSENSEHYHRELKDKKF